MHSSKMRTARSLTVSRSICREACVLCTPLRHTRPPCEQNDWQTPVKILPCRNFVEGGNNRLQISALLPRDSCRSLLSSVSPLNCFLCFLCWTRASELLRFVTAENWCYKPPGMTVPRATSPCVWCRLIQLWISSEQKALADRGGSSTPFICPIFTARKRSFGQGNMFTGVCLSTWGGCLVRRSGPGGWLVWGCLVRGAWSQGVPGLGGAWSGGSAWSGGCLVLGYLVLGRLPGPGEGLVETPPQMATAAGSTHPTGMHSCFHFHSDFGKNYAKTRIHSRRNDRQTDTPRQRSHETERPPPLDRDPPQTEIPLDSDTPGQRPPWTETPSHVTCAVLGQRPPPPVNRITITDRCQNIIFLQLHLRAVKVG